MCMSKSFSFEAQHTEASVDALRKERTSEDLRDLLAVQGPLLVQVMRSLGMHPDMTGTQGDDNVEQYVQWMSDYGDKFSLFVEVLANPKDALFDEMHGYESNFLAENLDLASFQSVLERLSRTNQGIEFASIH